MIKLCLTFICLLSLTFCYGQYRHVLINDTLNYNKYPFAIIQSSSQQPIKAYSYVIDNSCLFATKIDSSGEYSKKGDRIFILNLKPGVKLLSTTQLLIKYHVKAKYLDLPIYIDSVIIRHRETACFQTSAIVSVRVQTENTTNLKYINIHTIHHPDNSMFDVYINARYSRPKDNIDFKKQI